ncbi:DUF427 domain-containing protein [Roseivirga sp.]|uniref:DUF427 domain-containing protein n=1 Tax=Roseivirga sp. TaxID=1964215 RepID=UPI003B8C46CF
MKAIWNDEVIAESNETVVVEGNHYFPHDSINKEYYKPSNTQSNCPWKGMASYYTVEVNGSENPDAAWYYPETSELAKGIKNYVAFWKGVKIED